MDDAEHRCIDHVGFDERGFQGQCARLAINQCGALQMEESMREMADAVSQAEDVAEQKKQAGAERVDEMAKAVHGAADELGKQMPQAAELVHAAAARLQQGAEALRERNIRDLMETFSDTGRKQPLALFGGAVVAGFAISRFLKSSSDSPRHGA